MSRPHPLERRMVAILAAVAFAITGLIALRTPRFQPDGLCCDHFFYRSMAFNFFSVTRPDLNHPPPNNQLARLEAHHVPEGGVLLDLRNGLRRQPPFAYRVVTPLVARLLYSLTGNIDSAFYLLSFTALWLGALFVGLTILSLTRSPLPATGGMLAFALNPWVARWNLFDYMLSDPLTFFCLALAVFALIRRQPALFYVACLVGVFTKELLLPLVVAYPLTEFVSKRRLQLDQLLPPLAIAAAWLAFRIALTIPAAHYVLSSQFGAKRLGFGEVLSVVAFLIVPLWRAIRSPIGWSVIPFLTINVAAGVFVGNIHGRHIVQLLPVLIPLMFLRWPRSTLSRVLTMLPLAVYISEIVYFLHWGQQSITVSWSLLLTHDYLLPLPALLLVIAALAVNEFALWRNLRTERFAWSQTLDRQGLPDVTSQSLPGAGPPSLWGEPAKKR